MPTYDYACAACGHLVEVAHGVHGHGPTTCPNCGGGPMRKVFAPPTVHFKGSGWAKKDRGASAATKAARASKAAGGGEGSTAPSGTTATSDSSESSGRPASHGSKGSAEHSESSREPSRGDGSRGDGSKGDGSSRKERGTGSSAAAPGSRD